MPKITTEIQLSLDAVLAAIEQLEMDDLEQVVHAAIALRTQKQAVQLSRQETVLLTQINQGLPDEQEMRYRVLRDKRDAETLTAAEYQELLSLTQRAEAMQVERLQNLGELAGLRGVSLTQVMTDLEIPMSSYV
ncbi:MAG: STAS/SEC14 domain-containing protein [Spirulinaceae cyanobacterium]